MGAIFIPETLETVVRVIKACGRRIPTPEEARRRGFQRHTQDDFRSLEVAMFRRRVDGLGEYAHFDPQRAGCCGRCGPPLIGRRASHDSRGGDSLMEEPAKILAVAPIVDSTQLS